jgi:hypothetical protein
MAIAAAANKPSLLEVQCTLGERLERSLSLELVGVCSSVPPHCSYESMHFEKHPIVE